MTEEKYYNTVLIFGEDVNDYVQAGILRYNHPLSIGMDVDFHYKNTFGRSHLSGKVTQIGVTSSSKETLDSFFPFPIAVIELEKSAIGINKDDIEIMRKSCKKGK